MANTASSLKDRSRLFDIARRSALQCAAIHDILTVCRAIDGEDNLTGESQLRRIVAMLTKLAARSESVSETPWVYQTAFKHEHEEMPEPGNGNLQWEQFRPEWRMLRSSRRALLF